MCSTLYTMTLSIELSPQFAAKYREGAFDETSVLIYAMNAGAGVTFVPGPVEGSHVIEVGAPGLCS